MKFDFAKQFTGDDPFTDILGQDRTKFQLKSALLMNRHLLIVGAPGIGKTTLAKNVAKLLPPKTLSTCEFHCDPKQPRCTACRKKQPRTARIPGAERFVRVQGSPDLTVEDLLGDIDPIMALKFGPSSPEAFSPGKIFRANHGILFFDEVNRAPEKIQNSLLQVLEEGTATLSGFRVEVPTNFLFIGTMNPEEAAATEKLSAVFMDRVDVVHMSYPDSQDLEEQIVRKKGKTLDVEFPQKVLRLLIVFVRRIREHKDVQKKPSVRVSIGLFERAQANAFLHGLSTVSMKEVQEAIISVLSHRIELKPSVKYLQTPKEFLAQELEKFARDMGLDGGDGL
ncbi:AAA domain-containing protein [Candidatus Woesearchaeota archaeon]|nr:AAA domain-containing protein [Candidatus Woesearchaeota archaeon]